MLIRVCPDSFFSVFLRLSGKRFRLSCVCLYESALDRQIQNKQTMNKKLLLVLALAYTTLCNGQKAETIESIVANQHEAEWYGQQAQAWQEKVNADPKDQWGWRNLFRATFYHDMFTDAWKDDQDTSATADVIRRMEAAVPDSYVLNLSKCRFCLKTDSAAINGTNLLRAIGQIPDDAYSEDITYLAAQAWLNADKIPETKISELFRLAYTKKAIPERIMRYNWNMLQSIAQDGIYFGNGDNCLIPMKMLQEALGIRKDVTIVPEPFLFKKEFASHLWKEMNIESVEYPDFSNYGKYGQDWGDYFLGDIVRQIIEKTDRPVYFFSDHANRRVADEDSMYNEGLLLRYSNHKYDNFAVAMHNVRDVYHLEYLAEPDLVHDSWESSDRMDMNNVALLAHLIDKFRKNGEDKEARRLYDILNTCVKRSNVHPERKKMMEQTLEFWNNK